MVPILAKAVRDRQRPLRADLVVGYGLESLYLSVEASDRIVRGARRRARTHNAGRRYVEAGFFAELAASGRNELEPDTVRERLRHDERVRTALERMWPLLTPADLLRDLFSSRPLLRLAARKLLDDDEVEALLDALWRTRRRRALAGRRRPPARRGPRPARSPTPHFRR